MTDGAQGAFRGDRDPVRPLSDRSPNVEGRDSTPLDLYPRLPLTKCPCLDAKPLHSPRPVPTSTADVPSPSHGSRGLDTWFLPFKIQWV